MNKKIISVFVLCCICISCFTACTADTSTEPTALFVGVPNSNTSTAVGETQSAEDSYGSFFAVSTAQLLKDINSENRVYSPITTYINLAILAEMTRGTSQAQILELLQVSNTEEAQQTANFLRNNYSREEHPVFLQANSLWLSDDIAYHANVLEHLADNYYASSYQGTMGSAEYNALLQQWNSEQTKGFLDGQADDLSFEEDTCVALISTSYYEGYWENPFFGGDSYDGVFYSPEGEVTVSYMSSSRDSVYYYKGEHFTAIKKAISGGGYMWFFLPNEGVSVDEVLEYGEAMELVLDEPDNTEPVFLSIQIPSFDISSMLDFTEELPALGVTAVFGQSTADFSPVTDSHIWADEVKQNVRLSVNENGCTAAAVSRMVATAGLSFDPFVLNSPFLFVLTGATDQPLFAGVVNNPGSTLSPVHN